MAPLRLSQTPAFKQICHSLGHAVKSSILLTTCQPWTDNLPVKVKTTIETVEKVRILLTEFDADTERFLNEEVQTRDKITILALAWMIRDGYDDFEEAYYDAERKVSALDLTKFLMDDKDLPYNLQDVVQYAKRDGWEKFEIMWIDHIEDEDGDETN